MNLNTFLNRIIQDFLNIGETDEKKGYTQDINLKELEVWKKLWKINEECGNMVYGIKTTVSLYEKNNRYYSLRIIEVKGSLIFS